MPPKRKLSIETLAKLGAERLAELLLAEATNNRTLKQALIMALSAEDGSAALAASVRKRLVALAKSTAFVTHERQRELAAELTALRTTIVDTIGANDAALAVELLWQFLDLHASTFERADDSSGRISEIFRTACDSVGSLAQSAKLAPEALAAWAMQRLDRQRLQHLRPPDHQSRCGVGQAWSSSTASNAA